MSNVRFLRLRRGLLAMLRGLVCVLLCTFFLVTLLSAFVKFTLFDQSEYRAVVEKEGFSEEMAGFVREALEAECLFYDLPFTILDATVTEEFADQFSRAYAENLHEALFEGSEMKIPPVDSELYRAAIVDYFATLPKEEQPLDNDAAATIADAFSQTASLVLQSGISDRLLQPAGRVLTHPLLVQMESSFSHLVTVTGALLIVGLLLGIGCFRRQCYCLCGALTVGSMLFFVPVWLLWKYDLPEKLVLGESPLRLYVDGILYRFFDELWHLAAVAFIVSAVLLLIAIVAHSWPTTVKTTCE